MYVFARIRQSKNDHRMSTGPGEFFTLPFLQTSYPYRCRSRKQRSRIGMRFPSSADSLIRQNPTPSSPQTPLLFP